MILALGGVVTIATHRTIDRLELSVTTLNEAASSFDDAIQTLRSQIYISSLLLRDSILEPSPQRNGQYEKKITDYYHVSIEGLKDLERVTPSRHVAVVRALTAEVRSYWSSVLPLVESSRDRNAAYEYLRTNIVPRRQAVVTLAEELSDLQAADTRATQQDLAETLAAFRKRMTRIRAFAAALAALVSVLCIWRVHRLQKIVEAEGARRALAEDQLRSLAQKLVKAHEDERRSLARELHDHLGQMLTAIRFRLGSVEAENPAPTPIFRKSVAEGQTLLEESIDAIRQLAMGLRPAMLDDLGMTAAIEWYVREFSRRFDLPVSLNVHGANDVPEPHRTYIYRIVQEALTNCARHANATEVRVEIRLENDEVSVFVRDNGIGLGKQETRHAGFGLTGMEERVRELRGKFSIHSPESGGTTLEATLPLSRGAMHA